MKLKLSCTEEENLCQAFKDAYRDYESLKRMVYFELNRKNLDDIASNKKLDDVVFNLIVWARQEDSLLDLIWGAYERNPRNSAIQNITYKVCGITKTQWEKLYKLLSQIHPTYLNFAIQESFQPKEIVEVDSRLINLQSFDAEKIKDILKDNLIKKREQSLREIPVILEFVDYLSRMPYEQINKVLQAKLSNSNSPPPKYTIVNEFKTWVVEVSSQLNIQLETQEQNRRLFNLRKWVSKFISRHQEENTPSKTQEKKKSLSTLVPTKKIKIQPYLLISLEDTGYDLLLQGELVLQRNDNDKIVKQEPIYIQEQTQAVRCADNLETIGHYIKQFIQKSGWKLQRYRSKYSNIRFEESIIVEWFLPIKYFLKPMEAVPLPIQDSTLFAGESKKLCSDYPLTFRVLERFGIYQNHPEYSWRLENNWKEVNDFFTSQSPLTSEVIENKFEHHDRYEKWKILEARLRDNEKIGINIISPLKGFEETAEIMRAIIMAGIPIALWSINIKDTPEKLRKIFLQILTSRNITNLTSLLNCITRLRRQAYIDDNSEEKLGYRLGFLCDNPYRVPLRFKEDDAYI
ncbi:MAG: effector-associated domain EAD1-containing protein [Trichodesmium sp. MAG_R04]|nr:effector-associated domain EAD1-containing protein [Trichodesmium sp. MAG_R04]